MIKVIRKLHSAVNLAALVIFLLLLSYGCYGLWDSHQVYREAAADQYEIYKPTQEDQVSFAELKEQNQDVFGWLTVYGTNIDYPVVQGESNRTYINTNINGEFSMAGSIFLDYRNSPDFSDFNSIIYGHHMEKDAMFGAIGDFSQESYFNEHRYGNLFYAGKDHGVEFFAFLEADAYDSNLYRAGIEGEQAQQQYLDKLLAEAFHVRDTVISDSIVLLSTCTSDITNGRHILVGSITDQVYLNGFSGSEDGWQNRIGSGDLLAKLLKLPVWLWILVLAGLLFVLITLFNQRRNKAKKEERGNTE